VIGLQSLRVVLTDPADEKLAIDTDYSYTFDHQSQWRCRGSIRLRRNAMDTFFRNSQDSPGYQWRGLMIDAGRRFFPMATVTNLLDTMAGNKTSVLHLHASDECRWV
jgi:hypothetical protein